MVLYDSSNYLVKRSWLRGLSVTDKKTGITAKPTPAISEPALKLWSLLGVALRASPPSLDHARFLLMLDFSQACFQSRTGQLLSSLANSPLEELLSHYANKGMDHVVRLQARHPS